MSTRRMSGQEQEQEQEAEEEKKEEGEFSRTSWLDVGRCSYRGEGNANIVVAFSPEKFVLRFRKWAPEEEAPPETGRSRLERECNFARHVVAFFLGRYAVVPEIRRFSRRDVEELSKRVLPVRPVERRHKSAIEEYATLYPDYTFLPGDIERACLQNSSTHCIEIKPKQGYHNVKEQRLQKCSYCLTQYRKLRTGAITSRSNYCPLDLFSGEKNRMNRALLALLDNPQNNLKLFENGRIVYDRNCDPLVSRTVLSEWFGSVEERQNIERFCNVVSEALLRNYHEDDLKEYWWNPADCCYFPVNQRDSADLYFAVKTDKPCDFAHPRLSEGSVLERIFRMQELCHVPAEVVNDIYSKYSENLDNEMVYSGLNKCFQTLESREAFYKTSAVPSKFLSLLQNYFLYCTARDCSILIAFKQVDLRTSLINNKRALIVSEEKSFLSNVSVADLEPKNVHNIRKHQQRDADLLKCISVQMQNGLI